jgi:quercetin dioxygenase-like cupin family protein
VLALPVVAAEVVGQGGGGGLPKAADLDCPGPKRMATLRAEQQAVLATVGRFRTLRNKADLDALAQPPTGFSFPTHQYTSFKGVGLSILNPAGRIGPGAPNFLFYSPRKGANAKDPRGPDFPYELVGWGYGVPYAPDRIPSVLPCVGVEDWHIHERGVHDEKTGGMVVMPPAESSFGASGGTLGDPPALRPVVGFPHARAWTTHFWLESSGIPRSEILDPTDPPDGIDAGEGSSFYFLDKPAKGALESVASLARPSALQNGEGRPGVAGGNEFTVKLQSFQTGGLFSMFEAKLREGGKPPVTGKLDHAEAYYLLDGQVTFDADGQSLPARAGSFVFIPAGASYSFEVGGKGTARALLIAAPGGLEEKIELGVPPGGLPLGAAPPAGAPQPPRPQLPPGEARPFVLEPKEGEKIRIRDGEYTFKAKASDTRGLMSVMEILLPRGSEPGQHVHHAEMEAFYLLSGEASFSTGGQFLPAQRGSLAFLPLGAPHLYTVDSDATRFILVSAPGGLETFFRTLSKLPEGGRPSTRDALRSGVEPIIPPPPAGG